MRVYNCSCPCYEALTVGLFLYILLSKLRWMSCYTMAAIDRIVKGIFWKNVLYLCRHFALRCYFSCGAFSGQFYKLSLSTIISYDTSDEVI